MSTPQDEGFAGVAGLPPYRSMIVVDMKDYSGNSGRNQTDLTKEIPEIMGAAFARCGLTDMWNRKTFHNSTGDGYAVGLPSEDLPFLLNPYLASLQSELEVRNRNLPRSRDLIRLRVSVSVGPVADSGQNLLGDGSGVARVELHRLLDSEPVRDLLSKSEEEVTFVAAVVSARAYEDAVLSKYADEHPSLYVEAPVKVKTYEKQAYLRVPKPSGGLISRGFRNSDPSRRGDSTAEQVGESSRTSAPPVQINDYTGVRHGGFGNIGGNVGSIVTGPSGPVHSGNGNQYVGDPRETPR